MSEAKCRCGNVTAGFEDRTNEHERPDS